jgi:hypothetical protein
VSSDNKRTDEYWMGVRDALRMVDSFNKWAQRNPKRAKSLDDFIHDGLIAAAKRCESCLSEKLGLSFIDEEDVETAPVSVKSPEPEIQPPPDYDFAIDESTEELFDIIPETPYEVAVESVDYDSVQEIPVETDESSFSIDSVERLDDRSMEDIVIEGPQRDFTSDFDLVEPSPLVIDVDEQKIEESVVDETRDELGLEEPKVLEDGFPEEEIVEKRPAFTWSDYEAAVTPKSEPEPLESEYDEYSTVEEKSLEEPLQEDAFPPDEESIDESPDLSEAPKVWGFYDESPDDEEDTLKELNENDDEGSITEMDDTQDGESSEATPPINEPQAPPPPESEEDEEERRRRARRLFFGA